MTSTKSAAAPLIIHLVHGTWAEGFPVLSSLRKWWIVRMFARVSARTRQAEQEQPDWFEAGSSFQAALVHHIQILCPAREVRLGVFTWSGSNSAEARSEAAAGLRTYLGEQIASAPEARHFVVAHSHGGTVTVDALDGSLTLAGIVTLGTPFLIEEVVDDHTAIVMFGTLPVAVVLFGLALLSWLLFGNNYAAALWFGSTMAGLYAATRRSIFADVVGTVLTLLSMSSAAWIVWTQTWDTAPNAVDAFVYSMRALIAAISAAGFTGLLLGFSRLAYGAEGRVLRDASAATIALAGGITVLAVSAYSLISGSDFLLFILFWPLLSLFVSSGLNRLRPLPARLVAPTPTLPCLLLAIRLSGDEASTAIGASTLVRYASAAISDSSRIAIVRFLTSRRAMTIFSVLCLIAAVFTIRGSGLSWSWSFGMGVLLAFYGGVVSLIMVGLGLAALVLAVSLVSFGLLAVAVGPEILSKLPLVRLYCEPLPRCRNPEAASLVMPWPEDGEVTGLRHALYEARSVQKYAAQWIVDRVRSLEHEG